MVRIALVLPLVLLVSAAVVGCAPPPEAQFTAVPTTGCVPIEVQFVDLSEGEVDTWEWDFDNDGLVDSTLQNPQYTYSEPGTYTISLTVSGPGGSDSEIKIEYLEFITPCRADFFAEPTVGRGITTVQFSDHSTGKIISWSWDFNGDGVIDSTEQNPAYTYRRDGLYSVTLTIAGPYCEDTLTKRHYIEITGCPT